jgi:hypothetical protein
MDSCTTCSLMALAGIVIPAVGAVMLRNHRTRKLLEEADDKLCALCEQTVLEEDGAYVCGFCTFESRWADDPQVARRVELVRDCRLAGELFAKAAQSLAWAADSRRRGKMVSAEEIEEANGAIMEGQSLLTELVKERPGLLAGVHFGSGYMSDAGSCRRLSGILVALEKAYKDEIFALKQ